MYLRHILLTSSINAMMCIKLNNITRQTAIKLIIILYQSFFPEENVSSIWNPFMVMVTEVLLSFHSLFIYDDVTGVLTYI